MAKFGSGDRFLGGIALGGGRFRDVPESFRKGLNKSCHDPWSELCDVLGFMRKPWVEQVV